MIEMYVAMDGLKPHLMVLMVMALAVAVCAEPWVVYQGRQGPGKGKKIVFVVGDDEYRSEDSMPPMAQILAVRHGFACTVLLPIDPDDGTIKPNYQNNIPGLEQLDDADLMVLFIRFRELPDEQMKHIIDYTNSGRPIVALRTATHSFRYSNNSTSPYAKYSFRSKDPEGGYGRLVLGDTWSGHYGKHNHESTRGLIAPGMENHPIVRGITDIWGPSDVYRVHLGKDCKPIILGQVLTGMNHDDPPKPDTPLMPIAWTRTYTGESGKSARVFVTTMGHSFDFKCEDVRRLLVNGCYWALGMEDAIPAKSNVDFAVPYEPNNIGVGKHKPGRKPADLALPPQ